MIMAGCPGRSRPETRAPDKGERRNRYDWDNTDDITSIEIAAPAGPDPAASPPNDAVLGRRRLPPTPN